MNTVIKPKKMPVQTPIFEPFPEPRTLPEGWDLSALMPGSNLPGEAKSEDFVDD